MHKLNICSGTDIKDHPWVNLDVVAWPIARRPPDVYWDGTKDKLPFDDGSADECYCGYTFLHIPVRHHPRLIADIYRVLAPGGYLVVGEVDMDIVMRRWLADPQSKHLSELIWGEGGDLHGEKFEEYDRHVWGWTESKLRSFMAAAGFVNIERRRIHHSDVFYELTLAGVKP